MGYLPPNEAETPAAVPTPRRKVSEEAAIPPAQRVRKPFGALEQKMAVPQRPGYHRYWFNDEPGRVTRAKDAGYEHVIGENGQPVTMIVGRTDAAKGLQAYLMEIPKEWYDADMAAAQDKRDRDMRQIREGRLGETPGDNRYVPQQGIKITTSDRR